MLSVLARDHWIGDFKIERSRTDQLSCIPRASYSISSLYNFKARWFLRKMDLCDNIRNETKQPAPYLANEGNLEELPLLKHRTTSKSSSSKNESSTRRSWNIKAPFFVGMTLWLVIMAAELSPFLFLVSTDEYQAVDDTKNDEEYDDDDDSLRAMWGSTAYNVRMCSVQECLASPCQDSQSAPFICLELKHDKKIRGGCGATPWAFEFCSDQCDTSGCSLLLERAEASSAITDDEDSAYSSSEGDDRYHLRGNEDCNVECPRNWCRKNRLCGDTENAPFQCTAGLSVYGCSADRFQWTLRSTEEECYSCCKITSCGDWKAISNDNLNSRNETDMRTSSRSSRIIFLGFYSVAGWRNHWLHIALFMNTTMPIHEWTEIKPALDKWNTQDRNFPFRSDGSTEDFTFWLSKGDLLVSGSLYDEFKTRFIETASKLVDFLSEIWGF